MRLVAKHAQVGYLKPGQRPGCRNCKHMIDWIPEAGGGYSFGGKLCQKHYIECSPGAICSTYSPKGGMTLQGLKHQADMVDRLHDEIAVRHV
jgi:hypothetical protein